MCCLCCGTLVCVVERSTINNSFIFLQLYHIILSSPLYLYSCDTQSATLSRKRIAGIPIIIINYYDYYYFFFFKKICFMLSNLKSYPSSMQPSPKTLSETQPNLLPYAKLAIQRKTTAKIQPFPLPSSHLQSSCRDGE